MDPLGDVTTRTVEAALRGVSARRDAIADNIANLNTPGYRARRVEFESRLAEALAAGGDPAAAAPTTRVSSRAPDAQGNSVDLGEEMTEMVKNDLTNDVMINAFNFKINLLRTAIGRR